MQKVGFALIGLIVVVVLLVGVNWFFNSAVETVVNEFVTENIETPLRNFNINIDIPTINLPG